MISSADEIIEYGNKSWFTFPKDSLRTSTYDVCQKIKEANEALKNDIAPSKAVKQIRVKFCADLVHYEPDQPDFGNLSDAYDDSTDRTDNIGEGLPNTIDVGSHYNLLPDLSSLRKKKNGVDACIINESLSNKIQSLCNHELSDAKQIHTIEEDLVSEDQNPINNISNSYNHIECGDLSKSHGEISSANLSEMVKGMELNETDHEKERFFVDDGIGLPIHKKVNAGIVGVDLEEKEDIAEPGKTGEKVNHEDGGHCAKLEGFNESPYSYDHCVSEGCMDTRSGTEQNNEPFMLKSGENIFKSNEITSHQYESKFPHSDCHSQASDLQKSHRKYIMHHKWGNSRLPTYNGLNSEYGLTAEMLEERKRKAEVQQKNLWEKKRHEEEIKEQKRKENEESFKEWMKKKEAERRRYAEQNKDFEFVYDRQEAENAFKLWLERKAKELRLQRKQKDAEREYEKKLAQRRSNGVSQREFKRWLHEKKKKSAQCMLKSNNRRTSYKKYAMEKNIHMKNTCKIYLGCQRFDHKMKVFHS